MAEKKTTITDVARKAGVSISTVSRVFNDTVPVSDELRTSVFDAADALNYKPKTPSGSLSNNEARIGLVSPDLSASFFVEAIRGISQVCLSRDYIPCTYSSNSDPENEVLFTENLIQEGVGGIIFVGSFGWEHEDHIAKACERGIPVAVINRTIRHCIVDQVLINKFQGNNMAANHLIRLGHKEIGCVAIHSPGGTELELLNGFRRALEEAQLPVREDLIIQTNPSLEAGFQAGMSLLQRNPRPSAIFARSDQLATGIMGAAAKLGLRIPDDLSLVGFSDDPISRYLDPPLTTIYQPAEQMGVEAALLVLERIKNRELPQRQILIKPSLVVRKSTAPIT